MRPREGLGVVTVEMEEDGDFTTFKDEIDTEVAAIDDFPEEVEDPVITELHTAESGVGSACFTPDDGAKPEGLR